MVRLRLTTDTAAKMPVITELRPSSSLQVLRPEYTFNFQQACP